MAREKKRKSLLGRLISFILGLVILVAIALGAVFGVIYYKFGVNSFTVLSAVSQLKKDPNVSSIVTNAYTDDDYTRAQEIVAVTNNEVAIKPGEVVVYNTSNPYALSDKVVGALFGYIVSEKTNIDINIGSTINLKDYGLEVVQVDFSNVDTTNNSVDFNVVLKVDLTSVKEKLTGFPKSTLGKYLPKDLYISSTVTLTHGENAFEYSTASKSLTINNLNEKKTKELFKALGIVVKGLEYDDTNKMIGDVFVDSLIGTESNPGIVYVFKETGGLISPVQDFGFVSGTNNADDMFVVQK